MRGVGAQGEATGEEVRGAGEQRGGCRRGAARPGLPGAGAAGGASCSLNCYGRASCANLVELFGWQQQV